MHDVLQGRGAPNYFSVLYRRGLLQPGGGMDEDNLVIQDSFIFGVRLDRGTVTKIVFICCKLGSV